MSSLICQNADAVKRASLLMRRNSKGKVLEKLRGEAQFTRIRDLIAN